MKIIVLGCGNIGSVTAKDLAESLPSAKIVISDVDKNRAERTASKINRDNVSWAQTDATNRTLLMNTIKKFDLAVGALPGRMGYRTCKASISAKVDMVDVSYMPEDVMALNKDASKARVCIVPDCGMSPGLGSILAGRAVSELDRVESIHMLNGGLPEKPVPPLGYVVTWSVKDLIDMYMRKVAIVKESKVIQVEAMSGLEKITFPGVGKLEAFYTDGLRTMLHTFKGVKDMWEKSLRYPGHVEKIKLLKTLGFFDEKPVEVENFKIPPREIAAILLEKKLKRPEVPDIVVMLVEVVGLKGNKKVTYTYHVLDRYDEKGNVTAMARTTAYTTSVVAQLLAKKTIKEKGVISPEGLGLKKKVYSEFISMMKRRRVNVKESRRTQRVSVH
ncbi:MAG: saccharopine dehydrogenase NADP-binding domain-containing protein [Candidatus Bathyarchaeota archaeon]|nr:saccharopine dehydrogenase NADP-binding domain-containing protein [Candidatus Bathyarchaeota archaeon]MDH5788185.1 saccharopine dehydrogenase NADP-binding domain-containing protein [Candidatus Bathyarchaeota archaeon]